MRGFGVRMKSVCEVGSAAAIKALAASTAFDVMEGFGVTAPVEITIDLTAQELIAPPPLEALVEVDDVCAIDPLLGAGSFVANVENRYDDAPIELELSAADIDAFLEGRLKV